MKIRKKITLVNNCYLQLSVSNVSYYIYIFVLLLRLRVSTRYYIKKCTWHRGIVLIV